MIPRGIPLRIAGDVHGDAKAFAAAADTNRFLIQLGDMVDDGPDTPGALRIMFRLLDEKRGMMILGNHDYKLARALRGERVHGGSTLRTLAELPADLKERALAEFLAAPAWDAAASAAGERPPRPASGPRALRPDRRPRDRRGQAGAAAALGR